MSNSKPILAIEAKSVEPRKKKSIYPEPFASQMEGREKSILGDIFGLSNFGVNYTTLLPGGKSALRHSHNTQDEFIYILEGEPTLRTNAGDTVLSPGMCAGFAHGTGDAHQLVNLSQSKVIYLEIGDRSANDSVFYPDDDIEANLNSEGKWEFTHKDGSSYE
ncbi:MAG: cupin domain-containing protein [Leptospiraceae bacterium]|nr:cupin domain-containing protein [Leptospiraceae bacterium]